MPPLPIHTTLREKYLVYLEGTLYPWMDLHTKSGCYVYSLIKSARELNSSHSRSRPKNFAPLMPFDLCMFRFTIMLSLSFTMGKHLQVRGNAGLGLSTTLSKTLYFENVCTLRNNNKSLRGVGIPQNKGWDCKQIMSPNHWPSHYSPGRKALPLFFICIFSSITCLPEETWFQQAGSSAVEGTSQAVLGSSDQRKLEPGFNPICFAQSPPLLTCYSWAKGASIPSFKSIFCFGGASIISTILCPSK